MRYQNWLNALRIVAGGAIAGVLIVDLGGKALGLETGASAQTLAAIAGAGGVYALLKLHFLA